jgi:hypothetical protein
MRRALIHLGLTGLLLAGCRQTPDARELEQAELRRQASLLSADYRSNASKGRENEARPTQTRLRMELYHLQLPFRTISGNDAFWTRIDENAVDIATYDLLYKNGVRVGVAPIAEYGYFRDLMSEHPVVTRKDEFVGRDVRDVELEVSKEIDTQDIFYLDSSNSNQGRTYDHCVNLISASFQAAPRKAGCVRVALCPVVKSTRKRLEFTTTNAEREITYISPERLYDLNLVVDVPADHFLIVAPSSEATWPASIGNNFLVHNGPSERYEDVLIFVPTLVRGQ